MTTYNTGNPVGIDGSSDPRDLNDNAKLLDRLMMLETEKTPDRLGNLIYTWDGIRKNIVPLGISYDDLTKANTAIASGEIPLGSFFFIRSTSEEKIADEYQNINSIATATGKSFSSSYIVDKLAGLIDQNDGNDSFAAIVDGDDLEAVTFYEVGESVGIKAGTTLITPEEFTNESTSTLLGDDLFSIADVDGLQVISSNENGSRVFNLSLPPDNENSAVMSKSGESIFEFMDVDGDGPIIQVIDADNLIGGEVPLNGGGDDPQEASIDSMLNAKSIEMASAPIRYAQTFYNTLAKPVKVINIVAVFGQSFAVGVESRTVLSRAIAEALTPSNLMLGEAVRGMSFVTAAGTSFSPVGGVNVLQPLAEKLQYVSGELAPEGSGGSTTLGETVMSGLLTTLKHAHNERMGIDGDDSDHTFVGFCTGNSGTPIAELMKGAPQNYYNRYITAVQGVKDAADALGHSVNLVAVVWMQGENDYPSTSYSTYKASLATVMADMTTDGKAITGQSNDVLEVIYQTGGMYTRDKDNVDIGRAQIDYVLGNKNARFCGPYSPLPTPTTTTHLLANSYRWYGCSIAKCIDKALRGNGKVTFRMVGALYHKDEVYPYFEVPVPPIQIQPAYVVNVPTTFDGNGFTVTDSIGSLSGSSLTVSVYSPSMIKIKCSRELQGTVRVTLADKAVYNGKHNICDSDETPSVFPWEYTGLNGQPTTENIPELVNKPYVLRNWCSAYSLIAEEIEA